MMSSCGFVLCAKKCGATIVCVCVYNAILLCASSVCVRRHALGALQKKTATRRRAYDFLDPRPQIIPEAVKLYVEIF